jgi:hypothetical protein
MIYTIIATKTEAGTYFTTVEFIFVDFIETVEIPHNFPETDTPEIFKAKVEQNIKNVADSILAREEKTKAIAEVENIIEIGIPKQLD